MKHYVTHRTAKGGQQLISEVLVLLGGLRQQIRLLGFYAYELGLLDTASNVKSCTYEPRLIGWMSRFLAAVNKTFCAFLALL